jgi:hypothetical protein
MEREATVSEPSQEEKKPPATATSRIVGIVSRGIILLLLGLIVLKFILQFSK